MATLPANPNEILSGLDAELASNPFANSPRGGIETGFDGSSAVVQQTPQEQQPTEGPLLSGDAKVVFRLLDEHVKRYDLTTQNRVAQDTHWTLVKLGYPWSTLEKEPNRDIYKHSLPYGSKAIAIQAVPNKVWKSVNQTVEALMVDFPAPSAEAIDDSEDAENAADVADRFLTQDGSEQGTNDYALFHDRVTRALTCATSYIEYWADPVGGGYVPYQIHAHPQAVDPSNPLLGPNGEPTTDHVLRYVTGPLTPEGTPGPGATFTENPADAAPQWQPKLRAAKWGREHVLCFPEHARVEEAEKVIVVGYCTIGEAKRRWKQVGAMESDQLEALCNWTPERYMSLLPPHQRARWRQADGKNKDKASASDERIMFYYHGYVRACPEYPKGADVVVSGALAGLILASDNLSAQVPAREKKAEPGMPALAAENPAPLSAPVQQASPELQAAPDGMLPQSPKKHETRCMEIPVVQITPRRDPDELEPTGRAYVEMIAGACENNAVLAMRYVEYLTKALTNPSVIQSTSPIEGWQVEEARATGDLLILNGPDDAPVALPLQAIPADFFRMYELTDENVNSMASTERAASGSSQSQERSGKAIQLAVSQNNVSLSGMNTEINNAYARACRIKVQLATKHFSTAQQIGYIGEDGAYKQDEFTGHDFALIGKVSIKAGTGTLIPPDQKVQYLANLQGSGLLSPEEAMEAARPAYAKRLGLPDSPHEQYVERCIDAWLKGPPTPTWEQEFAAAQQQLAAWKANVSTIVQGQLAQGGQPNPMAPPPEAGPAPQMPFNPFQPRPNDDEPAVAMIYVRKLSRIISSVKWSEFGPGWRQILTEKYLLARKYATPQPVQPQPGQPKPSTPKQPSDDTPPKAPGQETPGAQPVPSPLGN